ncbi:MAG: hypothetical protein K8M05_41750, partial [Deltaproteobacteria bacterium]|nr:hypothetical protein [Kofleriaceae bacterium]
MVCLAGMLAGCLAEAPPDEAVATGVVLSYPLDGQRDVPLGARLLVSFAAPIAAEAAGGVRVVGPRGHVDVEVAIEGGG